MKILFIGDVVGQNSCKELVAQLPALKNSYGIDITIANGENSADGNGITPYSAGLLLNGGVDALTTGNHCFRRGDMNTTYDESEVIIRPANYGEEVPGKGWCLLDYGSWQLAIVNLIGTAFMQPVENPFHYADRILAEIPTKNIIVDFHAEATSEKKAMGFYLAGKVSAVLGTHTHVQTADERILNGHTGYITDVGMTGVQDSVLGIDKNVILARLLTYYPQRHTYPEGKTEINAVVLDIDKKTGACRSIERIN